MASGSRPTRRSFLNSSGLVLGAWVGERLARAEELIPKAEAPRRFSFEPPVAPVNCAVIGLGDQGREILRALSTVPGAVVRAICDRHRPADKRALELAPKAKATTDYRRLLDDKEVRAVWVATPSHLHKDIVLAALAADKHVYCEAPMAHTIADAKAIAIAARKVPDQVFQVGLQRRANLLDMHVFTLLRLGVLSRLSLLRAQNHRRTSWRRADRTCERQVELDWRLDEALSPGLAGEIGIHQFDLVSWYLRKRPLSVTAFGGVTAWPDGRKVPDLIHATLDYGKGLHLVYSASLGNSFGGGTETFLGSEGTILIQNDHAWLIKEADASAQDWEIYATREAVGSDVGLVLVANASKLLQEAQNPTKLQNVDTKGALTYACESFLQAIRSGIRPAADAQDGLDATVVALTVNEAVRTGTTITFRKEWFDIA
jgi:predicted dehydrogenase